MENGIRFIARYSKQKVCIRHSRKIVADGTVVDSTPADYVSFSNGVATVTEEEAVLLKKNKRYGVDFWELQEGAPIPEEGIKTKPEASKGVRSAGGINQNKSMLDEI